MSLTTPDKISSLQRKLYGKAKAEPVGRRCGPAMKSVGKPDAGNPHVRFDERGRETDRCRMAQATAPFLDSTSHAERATSLTRIHYCECCDNAILKSHVIPRLECVHGDGPIHACDCWCAK